MSDIDPIPEPQPFSQWLFAQRSGATHGELTDALAVVGQAVMETGKTGEIVLRIKVSKASKKGGHQMLVSDEVVTKVPKPARDESLFFFDERTGSLTRTDPLQPSLPLQEVPRATDRLKEA
jgi:hypothetical protein